MSETPKFQPGDVVRLNSGGPLLTVVSAGPNGLHLSCVWFTENGKARSGEFSGLTVSPAPLGSESAGKE